MNGKTILKLAAVAAVMVCVGSARAGTMPTAADDSRYFATSTGVYLKDGSLVEMGQFSISDAAISALAPGNTLTPASYATLLSSFVPLSGTFALAIGAGTTTGPSDANAGAITATFSGTNPGFAGGKMYLLVINSNTTGNATQVGVFTGNAGGAGAWNFPANMTSGQTSIDTDQALSAPLIGTFAGGLSGAANPYNNGANGNANSTVDQLRLDPIVAVPEPSTIILVVAGLVGMLGLRRRS